jgi:hypothetical protein
MRPALVSELRKVTSTQLWWILAVVMGGYMAFMAAVLAFSLTSEEGASGMTGGMSTEQLDPVAVAESVYTVAPSLGYVFPLVMGALAMTGEFRHQTLTPTFLAQPHRTTVLGAKLVVQAAVGALFGVLGVAGAVAAGAGVLWVLDEPLVLGDAGIWASLGWSVVALAIWGVIGVGVGTLIPNQVASVVVILAFTQFVEPILRIGLAAVEGLADVAKFLPGAAAEALVGSSLYSTTGLAELLPRWSGALVLVTYAVVLAVVGRFTTLSRDVT